MFTLEALQADHGEALLLRFDGATRPRLVLVDGGPGGIWSTSVRPRLDELRSQLPAGAPLSIDLVMVSHMDDDHIRGVLELTDRLKQAVADQEAPPYRIGELWLNAFSADDFPPAEDAALGSAVVASATASVASVGAESAAIVASIPQAEDLANAATVLDIPVNQAFDSGRAMATPSGPVDVDLGDGLTLSVIGPNEGRIEALRKKWAAYEKARRERAEMEVVASAALSVDRSVYNLSSIVALAQKGGRTILLTGDARGDDIVAFLEDGKLLKNGAIHVDVLKMPHHGSIRNVMKPPELLGRLTADHYVFSANGKFGNPDVATLELLTAARGSDEYTIHLTNTDKLRDDFFAADKMNNRRYKVDIRASDGLAVTIEL